MRLNKFLAHAGIASRRKCDDLIMAGHVKVNGKKVDTVGVVIDETKDEVTFKNRKVSLGEEYIYVLLNKPRGVVTTASDEFKRTTVLDLLAIPERIYPVGRLDYDTTGVLLLTNDGELTNRLLHPGYESEKIYRVLINKILRPIDLHKLQNGIMLDGKMTIPCTIKELRRKDNCSFLEIRLKEGRNRQIKRMFEEFSYTVEEINRISFSGLTLGSLRPGEWRYLTKDEITRLKERVPDEY
jgi:23S rRNA pseudouridine2605 synthase